MGRLGELQTRINELEAEVEAQRAEILKLRRGKATAPASSKPAADLTSPAVSE